MLSGLIIAMQSQFYLSLVPFIPDLQSSCSCQRNVNLLLKRYRGLFISLRDISYIIFVYSIYLIRNHIALVLKNATHNVEQL